MKIKHFFDKIWIPYEKTTDVLRLKPEKRKSAIIATEPPTTCHGNWAI